MSDPLLAEKALADAAHRAWALLGDWLTTKDRPAKYDVKTIYGLLTDALAEVTGDTETYGVEA